MHTVTDSNVIAESTAEISINQSINRFIVIWQLDGWITQSDK